MEKVFWNGFAKLWNKRTTDRQKIRKPMTVLSVHDGISGFDGKDRRKSISDTTTVVTVVRNDDLPLYLADSLLSIE